MKKIFTILLLTIMTAPAFAQILAQTDFSTYNGLPNSVPFGWFIYWNDTSSTKSFYTSNCGNSCPAYKFGIDSAYIISPMFSGADSVRFYLKGNGSWKPNRFQVYGGADTVNWSLIQSIDSFPLTAQTVVLPVGPSYSYLKFIYLKDSLGYNAGFDDVYIYAGSFSGINEVPKFSASVYPNPSNGIVNVVMGAIHPKSVLITVTNILGKVTKEVSLQNTNGKYTLDLNDQPTGIYMMRLHSDYGDVTQRIILRK